MHRVAFSFEFSPDQKSDAFPTLAAMWHTKGLFGTDAALVHHELDFLCLFVSGCTDYIISESFNNKHQLPPTNTTTKQHSKTKI